MKRTTLVSLLMAAFVVGSSMDAGMSASATSGVTTRPVRDTPIVAEVLSQPERFLGRPVAIYGLAVETFDGGRRFMLQDVSQMPLLVVAPPGERVARGSQILVHGIPRRVNGRFEIAADKLFAVQVVAGGGCC